MKLEAIYACIEVAKYRRDVALRSSGTVWSVAYDQAGVSHHPGIAVVVSAPVGSGAGSRFPGTAALQAGVPQANLFRDIGVSGSTGTRERRAWHHLNERLAGRDTLVVVAIDRIGRTGRSWS